VRINRFVAAASGLSRRAADAAVAAGRVQINGQLATAGQEATGDDKVELDGARLQLPAAFTSVMLNKPGGYVVSRARQGSAPTVYELLPERWSRLRPAGRLDQDSSGLLILSDDGDFIQQLTHPGRGKAKTYRLQLAQPLTKEEADRLEAGVALADGPSRVRVTGRDADGRTITVQIAEGRNRQLRRTFGAIGNGIISLERVAIGPYRLGDLPPGQWREFKPEAAVGDEAAGRREAANREAAA